MDIPNNISLKKHKDNTVKISVQQSAMFLYASYKQLENSINVTIIKIENIKSQIFNKLLLILVKLKLQNLVRKIKDFFNKWSGMPCSWVKRPSNVINFLLSNLQIQYCSNYNSRSSSVYTEIFVLEIICKFKRLLIAKTI